MSAGKNTGPVTARAKARERKAILDAHRAQRDERVEKQATGWYEQDDAIAVAHAAIAAAQDRKVQVVGALLDTEGMSIEDAAALLDVDAAQVRALRKQFRATTRSAAATPTPSRGANQVVTPSSAVA